MPRIITDYLDETAERFPEKTALVDVNRSLSFAALRDEARRVGTALARKGIFHQPVAVFLEQSVKSVTSFLGIAYSGNFYTVLDTKMPQARLQQILDVLHPAKILTDASHEDKLKFVLGGGTTYFCTRI